MNNDIKKLLEIKVVDDYCSIDVETTGLAPKSCEIIEIGMARVRNGEIVSQYQALIKPHIPVNPFITQLTGINNEMLKNAPYFYEIHEEIMEFLGNDVILGHNVRFDIGFINARINLLGYGNLTNNYVDMLSVSRRVHKEFVNHKLNTVCQCLGVTNEHAHRALDDCICTHKCYEKTKEILQSKLQYLLAQ